ncbi:PKD-like domain-containing protein [Flavobacterium sp. ZT3R25]|uniref:PKD-like domain-containing protein n=1 Tax=Flavobacterium galactosi TaxID=3398735 RepID=UPI003A840D81
MKKNYCNFHINLSLALIVSKNYHLFLIVLLVFFVNIDSFAQTISSFTPTNACTGSGASVVITGTGFSGASSTTFNGVAATSFIVDNDTQITAVLPATATTGLISVKPALGPDIISSGTFTVNNISVPSVSILANPVSPICSGTSVTFTATPINGGSTPAYQWYLAGIAVGTNSPTFTTNSLVNGNQVKVEMTSNAICPAPATVTSNILTMTVNPLLTPSVTIEATETTFCAGTSVTFSVDALTNGGLTPTYQWRLNGTLVGTNSNSFTSSTLSNNDVITLDVTSSASCAIPAMVSSNSIQVTVNPNATIGLTSGAGTNNQTLCESTLMTNITFSISGGGTGAGVAGLPAGISGNFSGGIFTISGTPTVSGSFPYTITTTGTCTQTTATGTITVNPIAIISLTSGVGTNIQTRCINVAISNIIYTINGGGTGAGVTGLPAGITGAFSAGTFTISGTPTAAGTFNYTVTTTGTCSQATATGTITVNPDAAISLTSGAGTNNQTLCASTLMTNITFSISGGGTGAGVTGLPTGISGNFSGGIFTISGTPTLSGSFPYTITTTGTCVQTAATGIITVNPNATISLTSGAGTNNQTRCINVAISNITFTVSGGGTGAGVIGLPSGVTGSFSGNTFTISGTPTVAGIFNYTVTTTGTCSQTTATGIITINLDAAISLTSGAGTNNQTLCASTLMTNIIFSISGGGTGAGVTGLPAGISSNFSGGIFTISGTPTVSGSFPYTITTTGTCSQAIATGTITVNPIATMSLTSGVGTNIQTRCINVAISNITYTVSGGGTGAGVTGLPAGITGAFSAGTFTISGTSTVAGIFNYTVTTTGTCSQAIATGTITVNPNAAISLTSGAGTNNQTLCANTLMTNITFSISGGGTGAGVAGLPVGISGNFSGGVFTISGTPTVSGSFPYTITTTGTCVQTTSTGIITVNPNATISLTSGAGTNNQTRCINVAISNITFAVSGGGTGSGVTGLPSGVTGTFNTGIFTISGTPTTVGTFNYTVTTTGTCAQATATGTIIVNPALVPSVNISSTTTSICSSSGTSVTFTASPTNGGTTPTYQWQRNGTTIVGATSSTYTTTSLANPSTITVVMTSNATCASPITATSNSIVMTVYTGTPLLPANPISGPTAVCPIASTTYSVSAVSGATLYTWTVPTGWVINSGQGTISINATATGSATIGNNQNISVQVSNPCGTGNLKTFNVDVNTFAAVNLGADISMCSGTSISLNPILTGNANALTFTSSSGTISGGPYPVIYTYTPNISSGTVTIDATSNDPAGSCTSGTDQLIITINQTVAITSQPVATQTACSGTNVSFSITASGTGLTYQWRKGGTNLVNGGNIGGATSATLTLTGVLTADAGSYNVVVNGASPCAAVTSSNAVLIVNQVVAITTQPAVTQTVCSGNSATFSVTATGTGLTYQWRKGVTNLSNVGNISGATTNTLTINPVASGDAAADYNVVITGTAPCTFVTSNNSTLVVNDAVAITSQPTATQTVCSGTNVSFSVTATGTGITYQWRKGTTNLVNGGNIGGATSATLTLTGVLTADAGSYNVVLNGASPCAAVTSSNVVLIVNQVVAITTQPAVTQTVCSGNSATFSVTATGTGLTYQWRKGVTNLSNVGNISGATTNTLTINPVASGDAAADYNVVITGTAPCTFVTSNNSTLVVNDAVAITSQPTATQTACSGTNVSFSVTATGTGITYQWRKGTTNLVNGGNIGGATSATLTLTGVLTADAGSYNVVVNGASPCAAVTSSNVVLIVNQVVAITTQPAVTQTVCSGNSATFSVTATGTGLTYQWRKGVTNLSNVGNISGATTNTLTINPVASGDAAVDYNVVITGTAPCTFVTSNNSTLVVNDAVAITSQPTATQTACSGTNVSFSVTATGTGITYQWRKGTTNLVNGGNISGATSATLTLTGVLTADAGSYNVVVNGASPCAAVTSSNAVLVVNQVVAITTQPAVTQTVCSGNSATFSVTATGTGLTYQWRKGVTNLSNVGNISGATTNTLTINPVASGDAAVDYNVVITGTAPCTFVTSNNSTLVVNDAVAITSQPTATQTACSGTNVSFSVTATGTAITYQWRKGTTNLVNGGNISGATSATLTISNVSTTDTANNYNVVITGTSPCAQVTSNNVILLVNRRVIIGTQPSNVGICASSLAQFGVVASGDNLTYQWYKGTFPGTAVTNTAFITGAQTNILNFSQAFLSDDGIYYIVVSGASPCASVKSNEVTLNVDQSILITAQPVAQTVCEGASNISFSVTANAGGDPITYQWRKNGTNISGATTPTYTIATAVLASTGNYDVIVSGPSGYTCPTVTSVSAALTVTPTVGTPTAITIASGTDPSCQITAATTTYATTATNSTGFNWSLSNPAAGTINSSGVMTWATGFSGSVNIQVTVNGCNGPSVQVIRTVNVTPTVGTPTAITIAAGTEPSCQITASTPTTTFASTATNNTSFNWSVSNPAAGTINSSGVMTWTTGFSGSVNIQVTANGCNGPSVQVIRTVIITPTVGIPTAISISAGTEPSCQITASTPTTTFSSTATNSTSFNWSVSNPAAGTINPSGVMTWTTGFSGSVNIQVTANGCNGPSVQVIRTVAITPTVGTPTAITVSAGTEPSCQITASTPTTTFTSTATNSTGFNWSVSNPAAGTINSSGLMTWTTGFSGSVNIQITANGCNGPSAQVIRTVLINPTPNAVATNSAQTICSTTTITTMVLSGNVASTTFNWTRNNIGTVTGITASGSGDISGSLTNTTNAPVTVTFTITPIANGCSGTPIIATVLVNPTPNAVATNAAQTICSTTAITTMAFSGNVAVTTYNWTRDNTISVTGIAASGSGNISGSLTNTTNAAVTVTFTITPMANGCNGAPIIATVLVNPTPNAVATNAAQTICSQSAITAMALSGNVASTTYNWTRDNTVAVTGIGASGSGNISGSLTNNTNAPVTVTFTITPTANGCGGTPITATVIINPTPNAVATNAAQTICSASAITTMALSGNVAATTYNWTRDNTVSVTGIAISGSGNISGNLTNTTSAPITVTFTITPTANSCNGTPITTTVLVYPTPNAIATPVTQTLCSASAITAIVLSGNVPSTTYNWTRDNTVAVTGIASSGSGNISGSLINNTNSAVTVTFTITPTANGCTGTPTTARVSIEAASAGGVVTVSQPSILPVVRIVTVCHSASGTIYLSGHTGSIVRWESSTTGGASWIPISNTGITYDYSNILATTLFRAIIQNGSLCTLAYSSTSIINVIPNIKPSPVTATPSTICNGDSTILSSQSSYATSQSLASGGAFDTANPKNWLVDGCGNCLSAGGSNTNPGPFQESATNGGTYSGINYTSSGKFVIANGNFNSILQTPVFNTLGLSSASLHFDHAYNLLAGASAKVEISIDGGTSYNAILAQYNGPATQLPYTITTNMSIDLSAYLGQTNLKIRFNYQGTVGSSWAIDNIEIPEAPIGVLTSQWVDTNTNTVISNTNATNATVSPTVTTTYAVTSYLNGCTSFGPNGTTYVTVTVNQRPVVSAPPGIICSDDTTNIPLTSSEPGTTFAWTVVQTGVSGASPGTLNTIAQKLTTTGATAGTAVYTITPTSNGCMGTAKTVTIAVNPRPTANIGPSQTICYDGTATFSIALTGTAPWTITYSNGITPTTVTTTTNPYTFNISGITVNKTYTITGLSDANCNPALPQDLTGSATVTVLTGTAGIWTGLVSTDWFDCKNWEQGLPSSTINAVINSGFTNMPVINPSTSPFAAAYSNIASAQDLIIANGASVTMAPSSISNLQISRDWKNSGSFVPGIGTVTFNGATANQIQTINAAIKTNETFYNLTTNNSGTAKGISVVDGFELTVLNNLTLTQGDLRLTGEAQLVQAGIAANPIGGQGKLLRDQQGQKNSFNYNYWSSPVSTNNTNYSIGGVLRDGTDVTTSPFSPGTITFGDGAYFADGAATNPIKISNRWLFSYNSLTPDSNTGLQNYFQWNYIGSNRVIKIGEGFTMKGTDGTASLLFSQNYVFVGKPNSGNIPLNIAVDQTYLIGNPYPSALDADEFIKDNLKDCSGCRASANIFNGALYFWDHFGLTSNHFLAEYVGGYATYTLMGGLVAIANDPLNINNGSTGAKTPKRYIPVAQGFFVDASLASSLAGTVATVQGGTLNFKNSQRAFIRESSGNSIFMKESLSKKEQLVSIDQRPKIRLSLASSIGINRQLLVGVDSNTTNQFDIGYDAPMLEIEGDNIYWEFSNSKFIIQAIPDFNDDRIISLGLTIVNEGIAAIKIDALENISETTKIYLYDNVTGIYHDIRNSNFTISLAAGEYRNRFSLQFTNKTLGVDENNLNDGLMILYSTNYKVLIIQNKVLDLTVNDVRLFNLLGQAVANWDVKNENQNRIQISIKNLPSGVYIVKLKTSKGDYSKKIIIK